MHAGGAREAPSDLHRTETVRSLEGLWIVAEGQGEMPGGGAMTTIMSLGYDPQRKRYVGSKSRDHTGR